MPESFGARLRRTREEQQISLATIAHQTKIKISLLEGLERDDVSHWPSGIFRRAYLRTYAQAIGLDPDAVVREFLIVHPEPDEVFETALAAALAADASRLNGGSGMRFRSLVGSALGSFARLRRPTSPEHSGPHHPEPPHAPEFTPFGDDTLPAHAGRAGGVGPVDVPREVLGSTFAAAVPLELVAGTADDLGVETKEQSTPGELSLALAEAEPPSVRIDMPPTSVVESAEGPGPKADVDWNAVAWLCTELGRVDTLDDLRVLLEESATLVGASGLIVWIWDAAAERLKPALAHGYSDKVLAHLPALERESDNATAAAFRSGRLCAIDPTEHANGALAVPILASIGPSGVLALELPDGRERSDTVRAIAAIVAAHLARLIDGPTAAEIEAEEKARAAEAEARAAEMQARAAEMEAFKSAVRRVHARR